MVEVTQRLVVGVLLQGQTVDCHPPWSAKLARLGALLPVEYDQSPIFAKSLGFNSSHKWGIVERESVDAEKYLHRSEIAAPWNHVGDVILSIVVVQNILLNVERARKKGVVRDIGLPWLNVDIDGFAT